MALPREPLGGEKGRATDGEYTLELAPQRLFPKPSRRAPGAPVTARECVGTPRGRFPRGDGEPEVVPRKHFALCPKAGTRASILPLSANILFRTGETTMQIYEELVARGLIAQVTDENEIRELGD